MKTWAGKLVGWLWLAMLFSFGVLTPKLASAASGPSITTQPVSQSLLAGANATFSIVATGQGTLFYQWSFNGTNLIDNARISGATNDTLIINNLVADDAGGYQITVSNSHGSVISSNATLTVLIPAAITSQPAAQAVLLNSNTSFSVGATGTASLAYQWQFDGTNLSNNGHFEGTATATLDISGAQTNDAGSYQVIVTNDYGSVTSAVVGLTVLVPATIASEPSSQSVLLNSNTTFAASANGTGPLSCRWYLKGTPLADDGHVTGSASTNLTLTNVQTNDAGSYQLVVTNNYGSATSSVAVLTILVPATIASQPTNQLAIVTSNASFTVTAIGSETLNYQWQRNGTNLSDNSVISGTTSATLQLSDAQADAAGSYQVVVTNVYGSVTSAVVTLTILFPPTITGQPTNQSILLESNTSFSATTSGSNPLFHQWYFKGAPLADDGRIGGSTTTNLVIVNVETNDAGVYQLIVTNDYGAITSAVATLTVFVPPMITDQPASQSVLINSNTSFSASVIGDPPFGFQWLFDGSPLADDEHLNGSKTANLSISDAQTSNAGSYQLVITNNYGSITSSVATLTILVPPTITSQPASQSILLNSNASFSVSVTGDSSLHCRWYFQGAPMIDNGHVSGSTTTNLAIANAQTNDAGSYQLIVTNLSGSATSSVAVLTVLLPPQIIVQPASHLALPGDNASFNITATGTDALFYQWQNNGVNLTDAGNISGSLTTNLVLNNLTTNDVGNYTVIVTNAWGNVTSSVANLAVVLPIKPNNQLAFDGNTATFSAAVAGTGSFSYQWQLNGTNLPNGIITTVAGNGAAGYSGDGGMATNATLNYPSDVAVDSNGNLLILDENNNCIRKVNTNGIITTFAASAGLNHPTGEGIDPSGKLFIADNWNSRIRKVTPSAIVTTVAGGQFGYSGDGGAATSAALRYPNDAAVDTSGNFYIADTFNQRVRKVNTSGIIITVAGTGYTDSYQNGGYSGDGGPAINARLNYPDGVAVDTSGNLFIADEYNNRIRKVDNAGIITTVAGNGNSDYSGDGGLAINAGIYSPASLAVDKLGNLFIADFGNNCIRDVDSNGYITTIAGNGNSGYSGDGGPAAVANLATPSGCCVDIAGNLFIADSSNNRIRKVAQFANRFNLALLNLTSNAAGNYAVIISTPSGSVTSAIAPLTVVSQPQSAIVTGGSPASFGVSIFGVMPASFQWRKNGTNLMDGGNVSGSLTPNLLLTTTAASDASNYTIVITNFSGNSITSSIATLTVRNRSSATLVQWSFDGLANNLLATSVDTNIGLVLTSFQSGSPATIVYGTSNPWYDTNGTSAFFQNTAGINATGVGLFCNDVSVNGPLDLSLTTSFTLEAFVLPSEFRQAAIIRKDGGSGGYYIDQRQDGHFGFRLKGVNQDLGDQFECNDLPYTANQWFHVALVWDGVSVKFYVNGVQSHDLGPSHLLQVPFTGPIADSTGSLGVGAFVQDNANPSASASQFFRGRIDEVRISDSALQPSQFLINQGTYMGPPLIVSQPTNISVPAGLSATFFASTIGPALNWQWRFNSTNIIGATNYFCQLFNVNYASAGQYSVVISNAYGTTNSQNATLTVTAHSWQSGLALNYTQNGITMPYRLYLPLNYNPATNYPVVIFLHGSGEVGTNNTSQVSTHITGLIAQTYSNYPALLLAPQVINYFDSNNSSDLTLGVLADVRRNFSVDDRRIYLTGLSMGAWGTTVYANFYPTLFAAIAPMSGAFIYYPETRLSTLPTWLFHGTADTTDPVSESENYYLTVTGQPSIIFNQSNYGYPTAVSAPIRLTELTGWGHNIWDFLYGNSATDLYDWMFAQTRPPSTISLTSTTVNNDELVVSGYDTVPFAIGYLLSSTNLQTPLSQWQRVATNWCDANGLLTLTNKIDSQTGQRFYMLQSQ